MMIDTPRGAAIVALLRKGYSIEYCETVVDLVIAELVTPTREMVAAGLAELDLALGPAPDRDHGVRYRKGLLRVIWAAMLDRTR